MGLGEHTQLAQKDSPDAEKDLQLRGATHPAASHNPAVAILTSQNAWIIADNKDRIANAKREAVTYGREFALLRDVRGITGDKKPFAERKIQFINADDAALVSDFLTSNPNFSQALLNDGSTLLGDYPHTKPIDGSFSGWLAQTLEFKVVSIANRKD